MQLAVLNPGGRDPDQTFPDGAGPREAPGHAPVNYHAYAACTGGGFYRDAAKIPASTRVVLVLLRKDMRPAMLAVAAQRALGRTVVISWKESGLGQIQSQSRSRFNQVYFRELCNAAHGALASTPEAAEIYRQTGARAVEYVPTPYPVDDRRWDFSRPLAERRGIFIGTRAWKEPSRRHEQALREAVALGVPVITVNEGGWIVARRIRALGVARENILSRRPYPEYLEAMSRCRVVFQRDASAVPGQVAGDALLCRMPCVGGDGAIDREAFAGLPEIGRLLRDDDAWQAAVEVSQERARARLSFAAGAERLRRFFTSIAP